MPKVSESYNLKVLHPELVKQWHPTKNDKRPEEYSPGSNKKVWWKCPAADDHEWPAVISTRTKGIRCPFCSHKRPSALYNLRTENPALAAEWHPEKNSPKTPEDFCPGSNLKAWWLCHIGHEWEAMINSRNSGKGCRQCSPASSKPELRLLAELGYIFKHVEHRNIISGQEIDVFIPEHKIGIEYDSYRYHQKNVQKDQNKLEALIKGGVTLVNIREHPLKSLSPNSVIVHQKKLLKSDIDKVLLEIHSHLETPQKTKILDYVATKEFQAEDTYKKYLADFPGPGKKKSFAALHPDISKEWDYEKNAPLVPESFFPNSNEYVYWICKLGHGWRAPLYSRVAGYDCSKCSGRGKEGTEEENLEVQFPRVAKMWNQAKNGSLFPHQVRPYSNKTVWWTCPRGHDFDSPIDKVVYRLQSQNKGCGYCAGKIISPERSLKTLYPNTAKLWHPIKNGSLKPEDCFAQSNRKRWWRCKLYPEHEWELGPNAMVRSEGKPYAERCRHCRKNNSKK